MKINFQAFTGGVALIFREYDRAEGAISAQDALKMIREGLNRTANAQETADALLHIAPELADLTAGQTEGTDADVIELDAYRQRGGLVN